MSRHDDRRRIFLKAAAAAAWSALPLRSVLAQGAKIRIGLMLPYTGTYAQLGSAIENGFRLALQERDGRLGGREVEFFKVDDESDPAKAPENASRLVSRDKVDVLVGTVHSGVALGMSKVAREAGLITVVPNAGADALTGPLCAPNIFRASFSNWQTIYPLGKVVASRGLKRAVFITWKYAAGEEMIAAFRQGYEESGGKLIKELTLPFPNVEFQALLTEIASVKPDAVACFFSGGGAVKFMKDYAAAGLKGKIPLFSNFLTEGTAGGRRRGGAGHRVYPALWRRHRDGAQPGLPPCLCQDLQAPARRFCGAGLRRRAAARGGRRCREGRRRPARGDDQGHGDGEDRQPAWRLHHVPRPQPGDGHLPAQGGGRREPGDRRGAQGAGRPGPRLQAGLRPDRPHAASHQSADGIARLPWTLCSS